MYKQLANNAVSDKTKDQLTPDVRAKYEALLIKARDAFYLTLDRLRGDKNHVSSFVYFGFLFILDLIGHRKYVNFV